MPVLPYRINPFLDCKTLYQFLSHCRQECLDQRERLDQKECLDQTQVLDQKVFLEAPVSLNKNFDKNRYPIATIALEINPVDPLAVVQAMVGTDQTHFYLEKPFEDVAIAAIDQALTFETSGTQRFSKVQDFLEKSLHQFSFPGESGSGFEGDFTGGFQNDLPKPQFFCSFTFFEQTSENHAPFPAAQIFLPRWQIMRRRDRCFVRANLVIHPHLNLEQTAQEMWRQLQFIRSANEGVIQISSDLPASLKPWQMANHHSFANTVRDALQQIRQHHLSKLVLAHATDVTSPLPFNWVHSLHHLRQLYPDCYIFSIGNGSGSVFLGASPERLIQVNRRHLETDALAGSAPRGKTSAQDARLAQQLLNSRKERHEHQLVVDFIRDRLSSLGLTPLAAATPTVLQLTNIQHLHTRIRANLIPHLHPLEVLAELHPTPAVAGLPRDLACQEIQRYEPFGRSLYAAPLGWIDLDGNAEFWVGIRSAMIQGNCARLFAGAGIVAGSDPAREQAEVQLKLQALLNALV